jgi:hypothetical protein
VKISSPWPQPQQSTAPSGPTARSVRLNCRSHSVLAAYTHSYLHTCTTRIRNHIDTIRIDVRGRVQHHADRMQEAGARTKPTNEGSDATMRSRGAHPAACQSEKRAKYNKAAPFCPDTSHSRSLPTSLTTAVVLYVNFISRKQIQKKRI